MNALSRLLWLVLVLFPLSASADTVRIYVTNSAGDSIHVIDPATNKVVQVFKGPEAMHGVAFRLTARPVSNEANHAVFERKNVKLIKQVPLSTAEQHRRLQGRLSCRHRPRRRRARYRHRRR